MRVQGWDPVLIVSQIICLQSIHYITLSLVIPPLLSSLTSRSLLNYSGGPRTVAHIMDWREMAARPAINKGGVWERVRGAWTGGKKVDQSEGREEQGVSWDYGVDSKRGWIIGVAWIAACAVDIVPLYYLIRRPTHILDFALTLHFLHLLFTTYYAKAFPTSFFYWVVQALGAILMIVFGEQLCVKREMSSELDIAWNPGAEEIELGDPR
ncbi:hypothetical protein CspeluHIS016_0600500 [Cutaneotrichosporon spelunceum]|uniref:Integral membrane protein S linking to the trans Golgi network-domain-containing protein n=1 Tax=Cutaneotrichosporon spelunceum TaxID=1672016 RepID=A0AAD3TXK7_9TREE|nr:hypothetical protein CspeluHIS016_0600500 [Cutaneotrichosporon spelunceum]